MMQRTPELLALADALVKQAVADDEDVDFSAEGDDYRSRSTKVKHWLLDHAGDAAIGAGTIALAHSPLGPVAAGVPLAGLGISGLGYLSILLQSKNKDVYEKLLQFAAKKNKLYPKAKPVKMLGGKYADKYIGGSASIYHNTMPDMALFTPEGEKLMTAYIAAKDTKARDSLEKKYAKLIKSMRGMDGIYIQPSHVNLPGILAHELGHMAVAGKIGNDALAVQNNERARGGVSIAHKLRTIKDEIAASEEGAQMLHNLAGMGKWQARAKTFGGVPTYVGGTIASLNPIASLRNIAVDTYIQAMKDDIVNNPRNLAELKAELDADL